jgi:hypothetical protein
MNFEDLNPEQEAAILISLDAPADTSLAEYLEEQASDMALTKVSHHRIEVRTDDQGGVCTGALTYEGGAWMMTWDFWTH